jgi:hypothetical protein
MERRLTAQDETVADTIRNVPFEPGAAEDHRQQSTGRGKKAKVKAHSAERRPCGAGKNTTVAATLAVRAVLFLLGVK